ncbi:GNAT family acetyltransferase [Acinetobacter sp. NRRL B-65365]|uniref:N-acetyltransferase n=1 Tax=Acinetobacter sp. NRRL B-65365 TaxID=1785092 RepID=UPI0007A00552|nr:N-acetyltransferase [Acinetobacter sp. NRRL B-65365]KYQ83469.1 GNAT family acetyltransferase [Acinetobacter sp. NRRL B-65365]
MYEIRKATSNDFNELTKIWLQASIKAHHFIPASYWESNTTKMQEIYLPMSEVYIAEDTSNIYGFIALVEDTVAALFVSPEHQAKGIGKQLISYAQEMRSRLELNVYQENKNSVKFYLASGFRIINEDLDTATNAKEYVMLWEKS